MNDAAQIGALTLLATGSVVTIVGSVLLIVAGRRMRDAAAIPWWAAALFVRAIVSALFIAGFGRSIPWLIVAGSALAPLGATATWGGVRIFHGHNAPWWMFVIVAMTWWVGVQLPFPAGTPAAALATGMGLSAVLKAAACFELWQGRAEKLSARGPLIAVLGFNAVVLMVGAVEVAAGLIPTNIVPPLISWFSLTQLVFVVLLLAAAVLAVTLYRERFDASRLAAANLDHLAGIPNRATFFLHADRIFRRAADDATPISLILFDLDNFKVINDTYGHAAGDVVLRAFSNVAGGRIRPGDSLGRIGGDEFCAILPGAGLEEACVIAERIRRTFEATPIIHRGSVVPVTVSAGVATNNRAATVNVLLEAADHALYRAKSNGRNRVERAPDIRPAKAANVSRTV